MRQLVIGDIHGAYKALIQVLDRANYSSSDQVIFLGDVSDGWPQVPECIDKIINMENTVYIIGNHDLWLKQYLETRADPFIWISQGGRATREAYLNLANTAMEIEHLEFLKDALPYYVDEENRLFVHGGFDWHEPIEHQRVWDLTWDRHMLLTAVYWQKQSDRGVAMDSITQYEEVFVGHTTTSRIDPELKPVHVSNVWALDQGAGWEGKLTCLDVNTKEYFQSDIVESLYPDVKGRD